MKKLLLLVLISVSSTFSAIAKKVEGKIIRENDTLYVILNIPVKFFDVDPNYESLQYRVKYFDKTGKKITVWPNEAKEIQFKYNFENVRLLSRVNTLGGKNIFLSRNRIFLKLEKEGKLNLFRYYYTQSSPGMYNASSGMMMPGSSYGVEQYILQKGDQDLKQPKTLTFKKDMAQYFSDCPTLVKQIESRDFRKGDMEQIVDFYNDKCGK